MKPETIATGGVSHKPIDVDPILAQTKQGGCRPLHFEEGWRGKVLLDIVALISPSSKGFKQVLLLQIQENCLQSFVSLSRAR